MKIVQFYPADSSVEMVEEYIQTLEQQMKRWIDFSTARTLADLNTNIESADILHCHGCWNATTARALLSAQKHGTRTVLSPHSQLEPWIIKKNYAGQKLPQIMLWQRKAVRQAYVILSAGKLETAGLKEIGWNQRIEVVRNAIVTSTTTPERMAQEILAVYRKVLDSNPIERISEDGRDVLQSCLKAAISGDARWVTHDVPNVDGETWRQIFIFAYRENLDDLLRRGIDTLNIDAPNVDAEHIDCFLPPHYQRPPRLSEAISFEASEEAYLLSIIKWLYKEGIALRPMVELARELRRKEYDEALLMEQLEERHLSTFFARLLQLLEEWTDLEEGFMPTSPINDKRTEHLRRTVENHLKI